MRRGPVKAASRQAATVRSLTADTSHELRTPLSTIAGRLDLHRQGGLAGSRLDAALGHIENEVGHMLGTSVSMGASAW